MKHLLTYWSFEWPFLVVLLLVAVPYLVCRRTVKAGFLIVVVILCVLCFFSPLHVLASHYLFSFHMLEHVLLLLCVGPLIVLSLSSGQNPPSFFRNLTSHPVAGWLAGLGTMWFWHVPVVFNYIMAAIHQGSSWLAGMEAVSLILAGVLFSAPVLHSDPLYRIDPMSGVVYLFTACLGCSLLGLLITFAPAGIYHHFLSPHDSYGLNTLILKRWNITAISDQQAAGLIMWVPCCLIYVSGALYLLSRWFRQKEDVLIIKQS